MYCNDVKMMFVLQITQYIKSSQVTREDPGVKPAASLFACYLAAFFLLDAGTFNRSSTGRPTLVLMQF